MHSLRAAVTKAWTNTVQAPKSGRSTWQK